MFEKEHRILHNGNKQERNRDKQTRYMFNAFHGHEKSNSEE